MADLAQPFRPRESGLEGSSLATIRAQLGQVRWRTNAFAFQDSLYLAFGSALLVLCTWVVLAFALSRRGFAVAVWATTVLELGLLLVVARRAGRQWIARREAGVVIDRRAGLEDRLATLDALGSVPTPSRLWAYLVRENARLLPFWTPSRLVPRAVPRSVWLLALALSASALVFLWKRPGEGLLSSSRSGPETAAAGAPDGAREDEPGEGERSSPFASLADRIRSAILSRRAPDAPGAGRPSGRLASAGRQEDGVPIEGAPSQPGGRGGKPTSGGSTAKDSPKRGEAPPGAEAAPPPRSGAQSPPVGGAEERAAIPIAREDPAKGEGPKALRPVDGGKEKAPAQRADAKTGQSGQSSKGPAGSGSGGDKQGLFGDAAAKGEAGGSFPLNLDSRTVAEPGPEDGEPETKSRPAGRLADEQRLDDAVRRAQVPPEYEAIIQRVFNRSEAEAGAR